jgi:hypothetical protein
MNNERTMGFIWGISFGAAMMASVLLHPVFMIFAALSFWANYQFGTKAEQ